MSIETRKIVQFAPHLSNICFSGSSKPDGEKTLIRSQIKLSSRQKIDDKRQHSRQRRRQSVSQTLNDCEMIRPDQGERGDKGRAEKESEMRRSRVERSVKKQTMLYCQFVRIQGNLVERHLSVVKIVNKCSNWNGNSRALFLHPRTHSSSIQLAVQPSIPSSMVTVSVNKLLSHLIYDDQ